MSRATLGFSRVTRTCTHHNRTHVHGHGLGVYKNPGVPNLHEGMLPEMTNEPRKGSASVNRHCRASLRDRKIGRMVTRVQRMHPSVLTRQWGSAKRGPLVGVNVVGNGIDMAGFSGHGTVVIVSRQNFAGAPYIPTLVFQRESSHLHKVHLLALAQRFHISCLYFTSPSANQPARNGFHSRRCQPFAISDPSGQLQTTLAPS